MLKQLFHPLKRLFQRIPYQRTKTDTVSVNESAKSKSEKGLLVGIGEFENEVEGRKVKGIAYGDLKVTLKQNSSNDLISIALSGKVGGGVNDGIDNFVFSATLNNTTLTKLAPAPF